jgi:hypothetical protein
MKNIKSLICAALYMTASQAFSSPVDLSPTDIDQLITDHMPIVNFHPDEAYYTSNVEDYLSATRLRGGTIGETQHTIKIDVGVTDIPLNYKLVDKTELTCNGISAHDATYLSKERQQWLADCISQDNNVPIEDVQIWLEIEDERVMDGDLTQTKAYVKVEQFPRRKVISIDYWYFYPYNGLGLSKVCLYSSKCYEIPMTEVGRHEGDWENVTVEVSMETQEVLEVFLSGHGEMKKSGHLVQMSGTHPIVYSAVNTHAFYATAKQHGYKRLASHGWWFGTFSVDALDLTSDMGEKTSGYEEYEIVATNIGDFTAPEWISFDGRWGKTENSSELSQGLPLVKISKGPYRIWSEPTIPVNGLNVGRVDKQSGDKGYWIKNGNVWEERTPDGDLRFSFTETSRDATTLIIYNERKNASVKFDFNTNEISYTYGYLISHKAPPISEVSLA